MAIYTLSNTTQDAISVDGVFILPGASYPVDFLTNGMLALISAGLLAASTTSEVTITTIGALTAATGVASNTIADVTGAFDQTILNNNFKSLAEKINAILLLVAGTGNTGNQVVLQSLKAEVENVSNLSKGIAS